MLKKISVRKFAISFTALFALFLVYLIPKEQKLNLEQKLEYVNNEVKMSKVFLLDTYNMLGQTEIVINNEENIELKCKELLKVLISGENYQDKIPNGFKTILPIDTKILSLTYDKGLIKVDFSKEILNVNKENEVKAIEAIVYTLTSIDEVENIIIYVEGDILNKLPQTKFNLPNTLNRSFGINKEYNFTSINNIDKVTVYYVNKNNNDYYYVPVTKYLNDDREKIKIVIDELKGNSIYNTNLMSFLNSNAELISSEEVDNKLKLNFNEYIFNDSDEKNILEEVIYTISLSVYDNYEVDEVIFNVLDEEIYKTASKTLE